jgi:nucleoside-diphosphate-sugar epimerase
MKVIVVGASGTIGAAVASALDAEHDVVRASRRGEPRVDLADPASIAALFATVPDADAVVCCAASAPLTPLADDGFERSVQNKLFGQVRLAREAVGRLRINAVSPGWVRETLVALGMDPADGTPAAEIAEAYVEAVTGSMRGRTIVRD